MAKMVTVSVSGLVALAWVVSVCAHHSGSMYVTTPIWVEGEVVRFENSDPHTITALEERTEDGQVRRWAIEGPARWQLSRIGIGTDVPKVGDVIRVCGFAYKPAAELSRLFPGVDFSASRASADTAASSPQFIAGHVLVMQNGEKRLWEPHGVIAACVRSSNEQRESWLNFLDSDERARQAWCEQRQYASVQTNAALKALVDEMDGSLDEPCV
jgi:hypothetical protein